MKIFDHSSKDYEVRTCQNCGCDITDRPSHHYLCYSCWKATSFQTGSNDDSHDNDYDDFVRHGYNETYEERYKGDSEYDMGPNWDYDEYPPENL